MRSDLVARTLAAAFATVVAACAAATPSAVAPQANMAPATSSPGATPTEDRTMATRKDDLVETLHGVAVADPYRWLEDGDSADVKAWTASQNERTRAVLDAMPGRDALRTRVKALLEVGRVSPPAVRRSPHGPARYFHMKRVGDENQPTLYVREGVAGKDRALIDPLKLSDDSTTALDWWYPSKDGLLLAYGISKSGSEDSTLHVRDVASGLDLAEAIPFTRHCGLAWAPDAKGFYYSRYPEPGSVPAGEEVYHRKIYFHLLGNDWKKDKLVLERPTKEDEANVIISPNGRWLVASVEMGWSKNELYVRDRSLGEKASWVPVATGTTALFDAIPRDERLYIRTNDGASNFRLYAVEYDHPGRDAWREVLRESKDKLDDVTILRGEIVATYLHDAASRIERFALDGKSKGAIALPSIGTAAVTGPWDGDEAFLAFESFTSPPQVLHFDTRTGKTDVWDRVGEGFQAGDVEVTVKTATSKDGTKVPMFVVARKGMALDGSNPTLLWGYGGFNVNETPAFSPRAMSIVERGGVYVSAVLRGGGEYGEAWHQAGMLANKQNVFDDFTACAEELIAEKITSPEKLGIVGGSNGGLLVAVAITQHPELYRVALSLVPLTDMIRYPRFRVARFWIPEYGDPEKDDEFKWLYAYSPYHRVKDGVRYPATLFATAESDSRVDPMHARKMGARLQAAQSDPSRPILLRVESKAGHGAGKPIAKVVDEYVDELGFAFDQLGVHS
jgi:prolyl oligopeptidase